MVAHQYSTDDEAQFDPEGLGLEPRMRALAVSNDALLDSLRPVAQPSIAGWVKKRANPWWRYVEYGYTEAAYWLWARAPWQRWALSGGAGALLGVAIVVVALPQLRPDLGSVEASGDVLVASTQLAAASAVVIAPLRAGVQPPVAEAVKSVAAAAVAAEPVKMAEPDVPTAIEVSEQVVEDPAAREPAKSKKKARAKKRAKVKSARSLSRLFMNIHRPPRAKSAH